MKKFLKSKRAFIICFLLILLAIPFTLFKFSSTYPKEVVAAADTYLQYRKQNNAEKAFENCYFKKENQYMKDIFKENATLDDYEIKKIEKINNSLYKIIVYYKNIKAPAKSKLAQNYVGYIDGKYFFIINKRDIPDNIKENFNENDDPYREKNALDL